MMREGPSCCDPCIVRGSVLFPTSNSEPFLEVMVLAFFSQECLLHTVRTDHLLLNAPFQGVLLFGIQTHCALAVTWVARSANGLHAWQSNVCVTQFESFCFSWASIW